MTMTAEELRGEGAGDDGTTSAVDAALGNTVLALPVLLPSSKELSPLGEAVPVTAEDAPTAARVLEEETGMVVLVLLTMLAMVVNDVGLRKQEAPIPGALTSTTAETALERQSSMNLAGRSGGR